MEFSNQITFLRNRAIRLITACAMNHWSKDALNIEQSFSTRHHARYLSLSFVENEVLVNTVMRNMDNPYEPETVNLTLNEINSDDLFAIADKVSELTRVKVLSQPGGFVDFQSMHLYKHYLAANPNGVLRYGQWLFNNACDWFPRACELIQSTPPYDCFHSDNRVDAFWERLADILSSTEEALGVD